MYDKKIVTWNGYNLQQTITGKNIRKPVLLAKASSEKVSIASNFNKLQSYIIRDDCKKKKTTTYGK